MKKPFVGLWLLLGCLLPVVAVQGASPAEKLLEKPDAWFSSNEAQATLETILSWQTEHGDWPKNMDTTSKPYRGDRKKPAGTFDNRATTDELRVLARAYRITEDDRYKQAFLRGYDHILKAQYANGGWPQYYPLSDGYQRHITFNDWAMIRLMEFLQDSLREKDYAWLSDDRRAAAEKAIDRGIDCIVKCQVEVDGELTVWCAQHDAETLAPVQARSFELVSLSGAESAGILNFLMRIKYPSPEIVRAIQAGAEWFEASKIEGYHYHQKNENGPALEKDPDAGPLWARFYEIPTNRPIFSDRDSVKKYNIEEIGSERRHGYAWYGDWGRSVHRNYERWQRRQSESGGKK